MASRSVPSEDVSCVPEMGTAFWGSAILPYNSHDHLDSALNNTQTIARTERHKNGDEPGLYHGVAWKISQAFILTPNHCACAPVTAWSADARGCAVMPGFELLRLVSLCLLRLHSCLLAVFSWADGAPFAACKSQTLWSLKCAALHAGGHCCVCASTLLKCLAKLGVHT